MSDSDASGDDSWARVDMTAFEVLGVADTADVTDADVQDAFRARTALVNNEQQRERAVEAFKTLRTEQGRRGYRLALGLFDNPLQNVETDAASEATATAPSSPLQHGGIAQMLLARDAPYAQLLEAALKVRGNFELELPQIVVCGTESMGKSSTLERIAMRDIFPRDRRFCTRMPVRLMLRSSRHQNQVTIRVKDLNTNEIVRASEPQICTTGDQTDEPFSSQVAELIRDFISKEHPEGNSERNVIVDREVQIEIRAPSVPTIDLVDLPGIVTAPEQASAATTEITRRFLTQDHVLALAVVSARSESLHGNGIWPLLREAGRPVVVVLTNVDRDGGDEDLRARLERNPAVLPHDVPIKAVVPVANRDTRKCSDIASLHASYAHEEAALQRACEDDNIEYSREQHGMSAVLLAINDMIREYMRNEWVEAELERCRSALKALFCDLWSLGTKPKDVHPEELRQEMKRGLDAFAQLPTAMVMKAVNVFDLHAGHPLPDSVPIVWRVQHMNKLRESLKQKMDSLAARSWAGFKALVVREILGKSELPLRLARFPKVVKHVNATLNSAFAQARAGATERALACATERLLKTMATPNDSLDGAAIWRDLAEAVSADLISSFTLTALSEQVVVCEVELVEEAGPAGKRAKLEEKVDAIYTTVQVLQGLRGTDELPEDFQAARCLTSAGPTHMVRSAMAHGLPYGAFVVGVVQDVLFPGIADLLLYVSENGKFPVGERISPSFFLLPHVVLELMRYTPYETLKSCRRWDSPLLADENFLASAIETSHFLLGNALPPFRADRRIVLATVKKNAMQLQFASNKMRADKEVVIAAVETRGFALQFASSDLRDNREVATAAVGRNPLSLEYVSPRLSDDKAVVLTAVGKNGFALEHASQKMRACKDIVLAAVSKNPMAIRFASEELRGTRKVVLAAVSKNAMALQHASAELREDIEVAVVAVTQNPAALVHVSKKIRGHERVQQAAKK